MTKQQLIQNATKKGFTVDILSPTKVGINKGKHCWHWFDVFGGDVFFNHTYSQNTGETKKGVMHAISVKNSLGFYDNL